MQSRNAFRWYQKAGLEKQPHGARGAKRQSPIWLLGEETPVSEQAGRKRLESSSGEKDLEALVDQRMNHGLAWPKSTASWAGRAKATTKGTIPLYLTLARTNSVQTRPHRSSARGDHRAPKLWSWAPAAQKRAGEEEPPRGCQEKQEHGKFGRALGKKRLLAQLSVIFGDLTLGFAGWF